MPANSPILIMVLFSAFQEIHSGCCTVAAPMLWFASVQGPGRSLFAQPPGAPLCELRVRSVPQNQRTVSPAEGEAGAGEIRISDCKVCSNKCEDTPSVICTLR
jgi:hypothetical protein